MFLVAIFSCSSRITFEFMFFVFISRIQFRCFFFCNLKTFNTDILNTFALIYLQMQQWNMRFEWKLVSVISKIMIFRAVNDAWKIRHAYHCCVFTVLFLNWIFAFSKSFQLSDPCFWKCQLIFSFSIVPHSISDFYFCFHSFINM